MLINNRHLHIETHGPEDGHPILLLHHGLGSTQAWRKQVPVLVGAACFYVQMAAATTSYTYFAHFDYIELPTTSVT